MTFKLNAVITQLNRYTHVVYPVTSRSVRRSAPGGSANTQFQRELRTEYPPP
ncbi:hypothetical protein PC119_g25808 [Phytophthora cactorum]|nr:hypothetical protein PC119_g25808 [Phytophthora cactorum]